MIRRRLAIFILLSVLALGPSCGKNTTSSRNNASPQGMDAVARLCEHVRNRPKIVVDTNQAEIVWSDGAILEFGTNFPAGVQAIISRPTHYYDIRSFASKLQAGSSAEWKNASVGPYKDHRCYDIESTDGSVRTSVDTLYVDYLRARYPTASIRIKGKEEPVLFLVGGELKASVMPVKL